MPKTLCDWKKSDIERDQLLLMRLLQNPQFYCRSCARAAANPRYLCKPERTLDPELHPSVAQHASHQQVVRPPTVARVSE